MRLSRETVNEKQAWERIGVRPPYFDLDSVEKNTKERPKWVHFGGGNIFRGFVAAVLQNLLEEGKEDTGINVIELFDYEVIDRVYTPYDNLSIAVTIKPDGNFEKRIIASVMEALKGDPAHSDWERAKEIFRSPSLQLASFTITEKGYNIEDQAGNLFPQVIEDMKTDQPHPRHRWEKSLRCSMKGSKQEDSPSHFSVLTTSPETVKNSTVL